MCRAVGVTEYFEQPRTQIVVTINVTRQTFGKLIRIRIFATETRCGKGTTIIRLAVLCNKPFFVSNSLVKCAISWNGTSGKRDNELFPDKKELCFCAGSFDLILVLIYLLAVIGLTPGGSSTVHIDTRWQQYSTHLHPVAAVQYTCTHKVYTEQHNETEYLERKIRSYKDT